MAFAHIDEFCKGVAMVLRGESLKASCYVKHNQSLGLVRERIVKNFIRHDTPDKFRVETGLVRNHDNQKTSRQCDLLVHESAELAPLYRWDDYVVVHALAARAVVEVKSNLFEQDFTDLLNVHQSLVSLEHGGFLPTFGYALTGASFDTCIGYVQGAVVNNGLGYEDARKHLNWPSCFVIQEQHCLGVCPCQGATGRPVSFCLVDLGQATDHSYAEDGIETGFFLQVYTYALEARRHAFSDTMIYLWFNSLPIKPDGKAWVTPDGKATKGNIP